MKASIFKVEVNGAFADPEVLISPFINWFFEVAKETEHLHNVAKMLMVSTKKKIYMYIVK